MGDVVFDWEADMAADGDDFNVDTSDQTVNAPTPSPGSPDTPRIDRLDDPNADPPSAGDATTPPATDRTGDHDDSNESPVGISDDTAHSGYEPPSAPVTTIGPDDRTGDDDPREESHDLERDVSNRKIEDDSNKEADPEPPSAD